MRPFLFHKAGIYKSMILYRNAYFLKHMKIFINYKNIQLMIYQKLKGKRSIENLEAIEFLRGRGLLLSSVSCQTCSVGDATDVLKKHLYAQALPCFLQTIVSLKFSTWYKCLPKRLLSSMQVKIWI